MKRDPGPQSLTFHHYKVPGSRLALRLSPLLGRDTRSARLVSAHRHGWRRTSHCVRNYILDVFRRRSYIGRVPLNEGVSGDEPESERDAASCVRGS